jgi:alpha-beta hydrolase superfamily lysophospholipase
VIKETRIDAIYGLVNLMDQAMASVDRLTVPTLVLIGDRDQIIPKEPLKLMLDRLPRRVTTRVVTYPNGYHLLLRDLQAEKPWRDIVAWVDNRSQPLPSGSEHRLASKAGAPLPKM